jgi:2-polyprenyl-6-methoxyphenol hydroxylase-like FAD-dependent oxidoreductase
MHEKGEDMSIHDTSIIDVLVVGAGPAGMTLACDLARRGRTIRIIDKLKSPPVGTRARGLSPRSLEIFEALGILDALSVYAEPPLPWRVYDRDNQVIREMDTASTSGADLSPTPDAPYRSFLQVNQEYTDAVLRERLSSYNLGVEWDCQLVALKERADYVEAQIVRAGKSEAIQARYLVGCDGGHSAVRKGAGISFEGSVLEKSPSIIANVKVSGLSPAYWHFWTDPNPEPAWGLTLQPMVHGDTWLFSTPIAPDESGALPAPTLETLQRLFDERTGMPGVRFSHLTWFTTYQLSARNAGRYRCGRVFLAGDAAHVGIAGGQGMNAAIQDAYNLGWKLALVLDGAPDTLLDTYEAERLPIAQRFLEATSAQYAAGRGPSGGEQAVTRLRNFVADLSQLNITYRDSRLARDLDEATEIRAGDRAPDAPCIWAESGEPVRLFDLFRGTHFTLLAFSDRPAPLLPDSINGFVRAYTITRPGNTLPADRHTLIDSDGHAYRAYGIGEAALILVRPDGYIGLTVGCLDQEPVLDYLRDTILT